MSARDDPEEETPALRHVVSNEAYEQSSKTRIASLNIPKNRSTGDLLATATKAAQDGQLRVAYDTSTARSPIIPEHEHGLGISGLRRIRQHPAPRATSRTPTAPASPTTPYPLPPRSSSMTVGPLATRAFSQSGTTSPMLQFTEDLTKFPTESLHSFSFAHQSEDALHSRQGVLKRAFDFMRDRLGWGGNHPGVITAQAKVSGDAEVQSMVELLIRAGAISRDNEDDSTSHLAHGAVTGPADVDGQNVFEKAFTHLKANPQQTNKKSEVNDFSRQGDQSDNSRPPSSQLAPSLGSDASASDVLEPQSPPSQSHQAGHRRTLTDVSMLTLQTKLLDALAKPYKAGAGVPDHSLMTPGPLPSHARKHTGPGISNPSLVHGHNNRWVPAAQAIFTTECESPWTILAANDLACLVFGVTMGEVKKLSMLEVVRQDRRAWLEAKLRAPGSESQARTQDAQSQSARTSPRSSSVAGGGITAALLNRPSWRSTRSTSRGNVPGQKASPNHATNKPRGVLLCGDIVPIQKRNGAIGAASLWVKEKRTGLIWVLEEIAEDVTSLTLDEDAKIVRASGAMAAIWGQGEDLTGRLIQQIIPALPLIDGDTVDKTAIEGDDDSKYYAARVESGASVPVSVSMDAGSKTLHVSSYPHIAGIVVLSASELSIIKSNSVFSAALFGIEDPSNMEITQLIPRFDDILEFLTEEDKIALVDGIVVPEHSFRRARALLAGRESKADVAAIFLRSSGLTARHRDGSEINIDVQMRVVRSERTPDASTVIEEKAEDSEAEQDSGEEKSEIVYALWITYSRQLHSAPHPESSSLPVISRPTTPPHQPSPGQTNRVNSPVEINHDDIESGNSPTTLSEKLEAAVSEPISMSPPKQESAVPVPASSSTLSKTGSLKKKKKKISDFTILEDMGQGAYGQVKLARYAKGTGKKCVLKYVTKRRILVDTWTRDRKLGTVPLEIHVLDYLRKDGLRHPNIVEMTDFFEDDVNYYIEMVPHGLPGMDLFDYIEMRSTMDEAECRNIFLQVVAALHHLHKKALVVHRDIKDENIVLDGEGKVKLIDFGSAAYIKNGPFDVFVGTIDYAAPEVLQGKSYKGKEQDIWALGILLYTLVYKENPFYSIDEILDHELRIPWVLSESNIDLIRRMLDRDVEKRLDVEAVMAHEWCREEGEGEEAEEGG